MWVAPLHARLYPPAVLATRLDRLAGVIGLWALWPSFAAGRQRGAERQRQQTPKRSRRLSQSLGPVRRALGRI